MFEFNSGPVVPAASSVFVERRGAHVRARLRFGLLLCRGEDRDVDALFDEVEVVMLLWS